MVTSAQQNSVVYIMRQTAYIKGNTSDFPARPIPDFTTLILVLGSIVTIATSIVGLLKWLSWKTKYGKSRTPIVLPSYED